MGLGAVVAPASACFSPAVLWVVGITGYAGTGFPGDGGNRLSAQFYSPTHLDMGPGDALLVADRYNNRVRLVGDTVDTVLGTGVVASGAPGAPGDETAMREPSGVAWGPDGTVYAAETEGNKIRKLYRGGGSIGGYVGDGSGPLEGITVNVYAAGDLSSPVESTSTDAAGYWGVPLRTGSYVVEYEGGAEHVGEWWDDAASSGAATTITLTEGEKHRADALLAGS